MTNDLDVKVTQVGSDITAYISKNMQSINLIYLHVQDICKKLVQTGNDQELAKSERNPRGGKKLK